MKTCSKCKQQKDLEAFNVRKRSKDGRCSYCRDCMKDYRLSRIDSERERIRKSRAENPEKWKEYSRKHDRTKRLNKHGLTRESFSQLAKQQDGKCLICQEVPSDILVMDHCHETGKFRGLLCRKCNAAIGQLYDDPELLRRAADYLESFSKLSTDMI